MSLLERVLFLTWLYRCPRKQEYIANDAMIKDDISGDKYDDN